MYAMPTFRMAGWRMRCCERRCLQVDRICCLSVNWYVGLNQTPQPQRGGGYKNPLAAGAGEGFTLSAHNRNVLLGLNFPTLPPASKKRAEREER